MQEKILKTTLKTLSNRGYRGTTARAIAAEGGFAAGVIYYHFRDLDDLLVETVSYASARRVERYREVLIGRERAVDVVEGLRELYREDRDSGHIAAVQELAAGCRPGSRLAERLALITRDWEALAAQVIADLLRGRPFASLVSISTAARGAVAMYLGMQTLTHVDGDEGRIDQMFLQARRLARLLDRVPRVRHLYLHKT
ncbi:TetR/AcrR family transcriptional regulator [Allorhizocola rhizosphaerae]|uniref:TetR/AcrR family transcriptional regulator n=1 Tax=Allorhizocola rhizosphaerae TaxID=1872709 RepID=UPI000E3D2913|nr:TetR/AcrR family transcriptional regulator [Allorhizocola rhizosphaerae]